MAIAYTYRHSASVGRNHQQRQQGLPQPVHDIAWKAEARLRARYRRLSTKGKRNTVVVIAIARKLAAFLRAIAREVDPRLTRFDGYGARGGTTAPFRMLVAWVAGVPHGPALANGTGLLAGFCRLCKA